MKAALALEVVDGRVTRGAVEVVADETALADSVSHRTGPVLVQPLIMGVGHGLFGVARQGRVSSWSGHERIRMMNPAGSGSSACRGVTPPAELVELSSRMMCTLAWDGLFMLEFLADEDGTAWFMELNGRTWGSMVLATRRGLSYPRGMRSSPVQPDRDAPDLAPSGPAVRATSGASCCTSHSLPEHATGGAAKPGHRRWP